MVLREQTLLQLAATKPTTLQNLTKVSGFTEVKIKSFGQDFIEEIKKYGRSQEGVKMDDFPTVESVNDDLAAKGLSTTIITTWKTFEEHGNADMVAGCRGMATSTIFGHLATCVEKGVPVPLEKLGVTPEMVQGVAKAVWNPPIKSF